MQNYYEILNVEKNASKDDIKNAYIAMLKKYHPDLHPNNMQDALTKTAKLNKIYETLKDEKLRKQYDEKTFKVVKSKNIFSGFTDNVFTDMFKSFKNNKSQNDKNFMQKNNTNCTKHNAELKNQNLKNAKQNVNNVNQNNNSKKQNEQNQNIFIEESENFKKLDSIVMREQKLEDKNNTDRNRIRNFLKREKADKINLTLSIIGLFVFFLLIILLLVLI